MSERKQAEEAAAAARGSRRAPYSRARRRCSTATRRPATMRRPSSARTSRTCLATIARNISRAPDFWLSRVHPDDSPRVLEEYSRLMEQGRLSVEYRFRKKDGGYCWIGDELHLVRNAAGDPIEVVGLLERHHRAQADRRSSRRRARPYWTPIVRRAGRHLQLQGDRRFCAHLHQPEYQGPVRLRSAGISGERRFLATLRAPRRCRRSGGRARSSSSGRVTHKFEYRFLKKDGSYCWVSDDQRLVRDKDGQPVEVVGSWSDVTAAKEADIASRRSQQRLTDALESIPEGFSLYDAQDQSGGLQQRIWRDSLSRLGHAAARDAVRDASSAMRRSRV